MPWWSWVLIWFGLFLLLVGVLALFAWRLFQKLMVALRELEKLAAAAEILHAAGDNTPEQPFRSAVSQDMADVHARREAEREKRAERVEIRRNNRVNRGKLLTRADYRQYLYLTKRT
ncbi:hypothetical protein [Homoserinimonas sp. OAct 916]|uniref:hypothetical protein n=1 Tax=Homoserinimonas sp. OAct 916 TaxID=2211450 RepID=UPI000DBE9AA5|nr:hypothetical protein [Homoserinimonas sp. OAct 916]